MKLYLIRHGQCESNVIGRFNYVNEDINEVGIKQAEDLREKIKDIDYDIIISSPLLRALHTAEIINVNNKEIITDDRLQETDDRSLVRLQSAEDLFCIGQHGDAGLQQMVPVFCK